MPDERARLAEDYTLMTAAFGKARARCGRALDKVIAAQAAYVAAHGALASTDALAQAAPGLRQRTAALCEMKVTAAAVARGYRLAVDIRQSILERPVAEDMASEGRDNNKHRPEADAIIAGIGDLGRANDALMRACEAFGEDFEDHEGDHTMENDDVIPPAAHRPSGSFSTSAYGVSQPKPYSVARQLAESLDRLGLPHRGGSLDPGDDGTGQMVSQLVRSLNDRFETYRDGDAVRVRSRQLPAYRAGATIAARPGLIGVDARALDFACDQLLATLQNVSSQLRFIERPDVAGSAPRAMRAVEQRLTKIRNLAASPQGIAARQAAITAHRLALEAFEVLAALGIEVNVKDKAYDLWPDPLFDSKAVVMPKSAPVREELRAEVAEVGHILCTIRTRLMRAASHRSDAEIGYRLEDSLERAMLSAQATLDQLGSVEMADTANLWRSIDIDIEDARNCKESLGNGLRDALVWLIECAQPFLAGDREAEKMNSLAMQGLGEELNNIAQILAACSKELDRRSLDGVAAAIAQQTSGLATIAAKCSSFANQLAY